MKCDRCNGEFKKLCYHGTKLVCIECKTILTCHKRRGWRNIRWLKIKRRELKYLSPKTEA